MTWLPALQEIENSPMTTNWFASFNLLQRYEQCFSDLKKRYSVFEIALNVKFEEGVFFNTFEQCGALCQGRSSFLGYWGPHLCPLSLLVYVFRCFFENGKGADYYSPASQKFRDCIRAANGNLRNSSPADFRKALMLVWEQIFVDDHIHEFGQQTGIPRDLFCSRCWLIKNFQRQQGNSNLCYAIRAFKDINDKVLRLRPDCYPKKSDGSDGCETHLRRILTAPGCELEREYLSDFVDNAASDDVRFSWFTALDKTSRAIISNLVNIEDYDGNLCFVIDKEHDFPSTNPDADRIRIKLHLRGRTCQDQSYYFEKDRAGKWRFEGVHGNMLPQPIWKVRGITKIEFNSVDGKEYFHEDVLGNMLSSCCLPNGCGVYLVSEGHGHKSIYVPSSNRRLPVGNYSVYAFKYVEGTDFRVTYDKTNVVVNGNVPEGSGGRSIKVTNEDADVIVNVYGNDFNFGINKRSPLREAHNRELYIEHNDPSQLFLSAKRWPLSCIDEGSWTYQVNGLSTNVIRSEHLYKVGKLLFTCNGIAHEEPRVVFVDFISEEVAARIPALGVGENRTVSVSGCGVLNGEYSIEAEQLNVQRNLPGGTWRLNIPVIREGVTFRTEEGECIVACPFKAESEMETKDLAIEDFQRGICISSCAPGFGRAAITSVTYLDGSAHNTHIPLLKDRSGFVFGSSRAYIAGRSGLDGDIRVRDLLSDQQRVDSFVVEEIPMNGSGLLPRKCRIRLYDPKALPVRAENRSVRNGRISIAINVAYSSHATKKVMRWLPSDGLDSVEGVRMFDNWTGHEYCQDAKSGRWMLRLGATAMHEDINRVFSRGAVILAFIAESGMSRVGCKLISGGFCLFSEHGNGLNIIGGDWGSRLTVAMHKRYNKNSDDLDEMLGIYTLRRYCNDYDHQKEVRKGLSQRLTNLRANIKQLGRGADLYMNSLYNARGDQWSGYAYLAGWYFASVAAEEIKADESGVMTPMECMCFYSSTGLRIWHPLMMSRLSVVRSDDNVKRIWLKYFSEPLTRTDSTTGVQGIVDGVIDCLEEFDWYFEAIANALAGVDVHLKYATEVSAAAKELDERILEWRRISEFPESTDTDREQDAADVFELTQTLRNALLALEEADERMRFTASAHAEDPLFCDLVRAIDARQWIDGVCKI